MNFMNKRTSETFNEPINKFMSSHTKYIHTSYTKVRLGTLTRLHVECNLYVLVLWASKLNNGRRVMVFYTMMRIDPMTISLVD